MHAEHCHVDEHGDNVSSQLLHNTITAVVFAHLQLML